VVIGDRTIRYGADATSPSGKKLTVSVKAPVAIDTATRTIVPGAEHRKEKSFGPNEQGRFAFAYVDQSPTHYTLAKSGLTLSLKDEGAKAITYRKDVR
jgi:hypothetical protein